MCTYLNKKYEMWNKPRVRGKIVQDVSYRGGEKCQSITWKVNKFLMEFVSSINGNVQQIASDDFTTVCDDGRTFTWRLAVERCKDDDYFALFLCFLLKNDCEQVSAKIESYISDRSGSMQLVLTAGNISLHASKDTDTLQSVSKVYFNQRTFLKDRESQLIVLYHIILPDSDNFSISKDLDEKWKDDNSTDVTLLSNDGKVHKAHKFMLMSRSSVFAAMFAHKMKEDMLSEVQITDMNGEVMEEVLRYIYTDKPTKLKQLTESLLAVANKYDLKKLKIMCEDVFISTLSVSNAVEILQLSDLHNATRLKSAVIRFMLMEKNSRILNTEAWKSLERPDLLKAICVVAMSHQKTTE